MAGPRTGKSFWYRISIADICRNPPTLTANWKADDGEQWPMPFGIGGGKVTHIGKQHIKFEAQGYYYALKPAGGPEWLLQLSVILLFPK